MSTHQVGTNKNFYCRDQRWQHIINVCGFNPFKSYCGCNLRECVFGEGCRGAHSEEELKILPHIHQLNILSKDKLNLIDIYKDICNSFDSEIGKVTDLEFKTQIENHKSLNFIELLNLWNKVTCHYRKVKKELQERRENISNVPMFYLEHEDVVWALERLTRLCEKHQIMRDKINNGEKIIIWDICCGGINCKEGCHYLDETICQEDFITGTCDCLSNEEFENEKNNLLKKIEEVKKILESNKMKSKRKRNLTNQKSNYIQQYNSMLRKKHYTDEGLEPFNEQYRLYQQEINIKKEQEEKRKNTIKTKKVKKKIAKPVFIS